MCHGTRVWTINTHTKVKRFFQIVKGWEYNECAVIGPLCFLCTTVAPPACNPGTGPQARPSGSATAIWASRLRTKLPTRSDDATRTHFETQTQRGAPLCSPP
jgi:hypothetical protein